MLETTNTSGTMIRDYIFFDGRRIAWRDSSGYIHYYFADVLGSTRAVTDSSGNTCFEADYYPYGQETTPAGATNGCSPTYEFAGYEFDSETGNYYAYARYYDPQLGRFLSPDPLGGAVGDPQSLNRYAYVVNNPETFIDPWGRACTGNLTIYVTPRGDMSGPLNVDCGLGGLKAEWLSFFSQALGLNGCLLWCKPNPSPDAILYMLRMHPVLRERGAGPQSPTPTAQPKVGPAPKTPYVPPLWVNCSVYRDGTGAGATLYDICMGFPNFPTKSWAYCVRGKLLQQYVPNGNPAQLVVYLFWDHPYDFLTCPLEPGE